MRKLLLCCLFIVAVLVTYGQKRMSLSTAKSILDTANIILPVANHKVVFDSVVTVENVDKLTLYARARSWVGSTYKNSQNVVQMDDPIGAEILCKGSFKILDPQSGGIFSGSSLRYKWYFYTLDILFKDEKYKYVLNGIHYKSIVGNNSIDVPIYSEYMETLNLQKAKKNNKKTRVAVGQIAQIKGQILLIIQNLNSAMTVSAHSDKWNL